ncbi:hypothetical protein ACHAW5_003932 [Stephanodiscus triporus]|uniref:Uncharacterized protein n=1 Tax=Stephanodiscus triporus TaxID=2934178 RepID=A0ABD3P0Q4_9STRA
MPGRGGESAAPPPPPDGGRRSTPSVIWLPPPSSSSDEVPLFGRLAESKLYDRMGGTILRPLRTGFGPEHDDVDVVVRRAVRDVASNALDQALGGGGGGLDRDDGRDLPPLFVRTDASRVRLPGSYDVRPVFTYPPIPSIEGGRITPPERYRRISAGMSYPEDIAAFVPEPVAAVFGAEYYGLLPPSIEVDARGGGKMMSSSVLVVDVGGATTCISLVRDDDEEGVNKTRTEVNVPYLTMDVATRRPRHMRSDISRNVVDAALEAWVGRTLVPRLRRLDGERSVLSDSLPPPVDLSALYASAIARSLEVTSVTPASLRSVLLVGGGARMPLVRESMARCVGYLAGEACAVNRLIMPGGEMGDELAVLGAAVWGSRRGR